MPALCLCYLESGLRGTSSLDLLYEFDTVFKQKPIHHNVHLCRCSKCQTIQSKHKLVVLTSRTFVLITLSPNSSWFSCLRNIWQLHIRWTVVQRQGCMETRTLPDLRLRQRNRHVRRGDLWGHIRLRRSHYSRRRVLPYLPWWYCSPIPSFI